MTIAIIKPDHLGDLVLSAAAIRAMASCCPDATLFVSPGNFEVARYLFPAVLVRSIEFAHLSKVGSETNIPDLRSYELVVFLRTDAVINADWARLRTRNFILPGDSHDSHQSVIDYTVVHHICGDYDIDRFQLDDQLGGIAEKALRRPAQVGLAIGSGFHTNIWPLGRWLELGLALLERGLAVRVVYGPSERATAYVLCSLLSGRGNVSSEEGGSDIGRFLRGVGELDVVIASDGGTAHLCSLVAPVISVFGSSPFKRYAPFGALNRLLTRNLPCSPCCQFAKDLVNGCVTTECMVGIKPEDVIAALDLPMEYAYPRSTHVGNNVSLFIGTSHLDRREKLVMFWQAIGYDPQSSSV